MEPPAIVQRELAYHRRDVPVVDGVRMSVIDQAPEGSGSGETVLFLHGNPAWSLLWRNLIPPMLEAGHRVIAPDLIGFGLSEKPLAPAYHSLERHIANLEAMAEEMELEGLTLVLHDWGGPMGLGLATRHSERIERIVIANTLAFPPRNERSLSAWHRILSSTPGKALATRFNLVARSAFRMGVRDRLPEDVKEGYLWPMRERGARVAASELVRMVPDGPEHPSARTLERIQAGYPELKDRPVRVLWADGDPVMRAKLANKWVDAFPQAELSHVSETASHFWQEDEPEAFAQEILAFIAGN